MRFASLGSGSRGNATVVEVAGTSVLIGRGLSLAQVRRRLARLGRSPAAPAEIRLIMSTPPTWAGSPGWRMRAASPCG